MLNRYAYADQIFDQLNKATPDQIDEILEANQDNKDLEALCRLLFDYRSYKFELRRVPKYNRKAATGVRIFQVLDRMETVLNGRLISEKTKYEKLTSMLQLLEERDAIVLEKALTGELAPNLTIEDAQKYFSKIRALPMLERRAGTIADFAYPGHLVTLPRMGIPLAVRVNQFHNCKFIDLATGQAMILPNKVQSAFSTSFWEYSSVVFFGVFEALTKDGKLSSRERTTKEKFRDFLAGVLEDENFRITMYDSCNIQTWENLGKNVPLLTGDYRRKWLQAQNFKTDKIKVATFQDIKSAEDLRAMENKLITTSDRVRYYPSKQYFRDGYYVIGKELF